MRNQNDCFFTGRLTRDPELRHTASGLAVTDVSIAVNNDYKNKDGDWVNKVVFVELNVWNGQGEALCKKAAKGDLIRVRTSFSPDSWTDKESGQKRTVARFTINEWEMMAKTGSSGSANKDESDEEVKPEPKKKDRPAKSEKKVEVVEAELVDDEEDDQIPF